MLTHDRLGTGAGGRRTQVPLWPGRLQTSFGPSQAELQQTPSTHSMDWHSSGLVQESPIGRSVGVGTGVAVDTAAGVPVGVAVLASVTVGV